MSPLLSFIKPASFISIPSLQTGFTGRSQTTDYTCGTVSGLNAMDELDPSGCADAAEEMNFWAAAHCEYMGEGEPGCVHYGLMRGALHRGFKVAAHGADFARIDQAMETLAGTPHKTALFQRRVADQVKDVARLGGRFEHGDLSMALFETIDRRGQKAIILHRDPFGIEHWAGVKKQGEKIQLHDPHPDNRAYYRTVSGSDVPSLTIDQLKRISDFNGSHMVLAFGLNN